jgi:hypothetical protein
MNTQPSPVSAEAMREKFERWESDNGQWPRAIERDVRGQYRLIQAVNDWRVWQAAIAAERDAAKAGVTDELLGAIARGWCSPENSHKEMDSALALAIASEVAHLLSSASVLDTGALMHFVDGLGWVVQCSKTTIYVEKLHSLLHAASPPTTSEPMTLTFL